MEPCVLPDLVFSQILRPAQTQLFTGVEAVPNHSHVVQPDWRVVLGTDRCKHVAECQERVGNGTIVFVGSVIDTLISHRQETTATPESQGDKPQRWLPPGLHVSDAKSYVQAMAMDAWASRAHRGNDAGGRLL